MATVLGIGIATLDIINEVDGYPAEDAEVRALAQRRARGGNATNTLVVLAQHGHRCHWGGVLSDEADAVGIRGDLERHGVVTTPCRVVAGGRVPTSYVTLNRRNGSRTIIHYRDLPEFGFLDFAVVDLAPFDWIHFEGRNLAETRRMLEHAARTAPGARRSLEVEKPHEGIDALLPLADVLLFSRRFAQARGYGSAPDLLTDLQPRSPDALLVCAWGEAGAWALEPDGTLHQSPAYPPPRVVDTLGAGDVFNAGIIHALLDGAPVGQAIDRAGRLAGRKCGQAGLDGLAGDAG